jgi:hypothetical protein
MIESLVLLVAVAEGAAPPPPSPWEEVQLRAVPLADAMGEFRRLCLVRPFDRAAFDAAASASPWNYRHILDPRRPYADDWRATRADATFNSSGQVPRGFAVPQCNFLAATAQPVGRSVIEAAVTSTLRQAGIGTAKATPTDGGTVWTWSAGSGVARLHLHASGRSQQEIDLSLQFWTPESLARSPAITRLLIREGKAFPKPTKAEDQ